MYNTTFMLVFVANVGVRKERPHPRAARSAASPSPSCSGKRPKVERWRGVNGLANNGLISQKKIRQAMQTIVGRWPPCHVLQPPIYFFIMEDGARRPLSYQKIARNIASKQRQAMQTIVGRWSPCPVLQHPSSSTHPPAAEIGYLMEDGARRPLSYFDITCLNRPPSYLAN